MIDDIVKCVYKVEPDHLDYIKYLTNGKDPYENVDKTLRNGKDFGGDKLLILDTIWECKGKVTMTKMKFVCDTTVRNGFILSKTASMVLRSMDRIEQDPELDTLFIRIKDKRFKVKHSDSWFTNVLGADVLIFLGYLKREITDYSVF